MRIAVLLLVTVLLSCSTPQLVREDLPPRPASLKAAFDAMPKPAHARIAVLQDNVDAWSARWKTIEAATERVDVTYFIIEPDAYGISLLGLLYEKQRAGVKVRLMVDSRGTFGLSRPMLGLNLLGELAASGAEVRIYNPMEMQIADAVASGDLRTLAASNHDKLVIADRKIAVTGGRNISKDYLMDPRDLKGAYIDMDILVDGEQAAKALTEAFASELKASRSVSMKAPKSDASSDALLLAARAMRTWMGDAPLADALALEGSAVGSMDHIPADSARELLRKLSVEIATAAHLRGALARALPPYSDGMEPMHILDTHSSQGDTTRNLVNENLMTAVMAAQQEVIIQSPYFVLTNRGMRVLEDASDRGVHITILTNSPVSSDSPITQAAFLEQWPEILARVPNARLFVVGESRLMHAKVGIIDNVLALVGSYNLDPLSAGVNGEVLNALWSPDVAEAQRNLIVARIALGAPSVVEYTVKRDAAGKAIIVDGKAVIDVGPESHCDEEALGKVKRIKPMLKLLAPLI